MDLIKLYYRKKITRKKKERKGRTFRFNFSDKVC